jgi:superfamily I DNA/RNA helicase
MKMGPHRAAGGPEVHCWAAETVPDEAEVIATTIEELRKKGYRYKDIAILFRSVRTSSPPLIEVFNRPVASRKSWPTSWPASRKLFDYLQYYALDASEGRPRQPDNLAPGVAPARRVNCP